MKWTLSILMTLALIAPALALAQTDDQASGGGAEFQPEPNIYFDEATFLSNQNDWRRQFDVVIVINKNRELLDDNGGSGSETIDVYRFGKLMIRSWVSTGREILQKHIDNPNIESPAHDYFSQTPTGYYSVRMLDIDHVSNTWKDAFMPWAVFFNGGIATHRSPDENLAAGRRDKFIGYRNSGGCTRLHEQVAKAIFWWVRASGGPYTFNEMNNCHFAGEAATAQQTYTPEQPFYDSADQILAPDFDINGNFLSSSIKHHYKTLVIVENVPVHESQQTLADRGDRLHTYGYKDGKYIFFSGNQFYAFQLPTKLSGPAPWYNWKNLPDATIQLGETLVKLSATVDLTNYYVAPVYHAEDLPEGNIPQCELNKLAQDRAARDAAASGADTTNLMQDTSNNEPQAATSQDSFTLQPPAPVGSQGSQAVPGQKCYSLGRMLGLCK